MRHDSTFKGIYAGLAIVAVAGVFVFALKVGGSAYQRHVESTPPLSSWPTARILDELGEYDTKIPDCAGLVEGMTGYAYAKVNAVTGQLKRIVIVCK